MASSSQQSSRSRKRTGSIIQSHTLQQGRETAHRNHSFFHIFLLHNFSLPPNGQQGLRTSQCFLVEPLEGLTGTFEKPSPWAPKRNQSPIPEEHPQQHLLLLFLFIKK